MLASFNAADAADAADARLGGWIELCAAAFWAVAASSWVDVTAALWAASAHSWVDATFCWAHAADWYGSGGTD
jgi:hypothetical protein